MAKWDKNPETCLITDKNSENLSFYESECLRNVPKLLIISSSLLSSGRRSNRTRFRKKFQKPLSCTLWCTARNHFCRFFVARNEIIKGYLPACYNSS